MKLTRLTPSIPFRNCSTISVSCGTKLFEKRKKKGLVVVLCGSSGTLSTSTSLYTKEQMPPQLGFPNPSSLMMTILTDHRCIHCAISPTTTYTQYNTSPRCQLQRLPSLPPLDLLPAPTHPRRVCFLTTTSPSSSPPPTKVISRLNPQNGHHYKCHLANHTPIIRYSYLMCLDLVPFLLPPLIQSQVGRVSATRLTFSLMPSGTKARDSPLS
jgi:hypothetical protein